MKTKSVTVVAHLYTPIRNYYLVGNPYPVSSDEFNSVWLLAVPMGNVDILEDGTQVFDYPRKITVTGDCVVENVPNPYDILIKE